MIEPGATAEIVLAVVFVLIRPVPPVPAVRTTFWPCRRPWVGDPLMSPAEATLTFPPVALKTSGATPTVGLVKLANRTSESVTVAIAFCERKTDVPSAPKPVIVEPAGIPSPSTAIPIMRPSVDLRPVNRLLSAVSVAVMTMELSTSQPVPRPTVPSLTYTNVSYAKFAPKLASEARVHAPAAARYTPLADGVI